MRVLVTGAAGFTGRWMMDLLAAQNCVTPIGLVRREKPHDESMSCSTVLADLLDKKNLQAVVTKIRPDTLIHLAGLTHGASDELHTTNVEGTRHLLDAALACNPECRILIISSSAVYGSVSDKQIPENAPHQPVSEYGKSKAEQELLALQYTSTRDAAIAIARPFNLVGPGLPDSFLCGRIVNQIVAIERGEREALDLWELSSSRDLIDVRDVVRGYWALASCPNFTEVCSGKAFNLGSGNAYRVSSIITLVEEITGRHYTIRLPEIPPHVPVQTQRSDNSRIQSLTGWEPEIPLETTLRDMLDIERNLWRA